MVQKKKISLGGSSAAARPNAVAAEPSREVLELFFRTGTVFHDVAIGELPDVVSGFVRGAAPANAGEAPQTEGWSLRRAAQGEEPDVEVSALEAVHELSRRWLPVPYQLSAPYVVQLWLAPNDDGSFAAALAVDTRESHAAPGGDASLAANGRWLDASLDEGRPFRPLERDELGTFLDHPHTRDWLRKLEKSGIERAPFKLAALLEIVGPRLPRLRFARAEKETTTPVSLIVDLGNSRSTALLVESQRGGAVAAPGESSGLSAVPLAMRRGSDPLSVSDDPIDARLTFLPSPFDRAAFDVCVGEAFAWPSIARLGREAMDRALETPHRYLCTLSGPKRYLWDDRPTRDPWTFASSAASSASLPADNEPRTLFGRVLKYLVDEDGGLTLRADGPSTPVDPRYAPRTTMLFAFVEILTQAYAQIQSASYRKFQGREGAARSLRHVCVTYPSGMPAEERAVYEALIRNAVLLSTWLLGIPEEDRPNYDFASKTFRPFLFVDEAMAAQMVYVFEEVAGTFSGSMEDLLNVYGRADVQKDGGATREKSLRIASVDIGGGTTDVMIAEYRDRQPGAGTSLAVRTLFQDGVSIAGDEVCRAILEEVVFPQITAALPPASARRWAHLFGDGDAGHGAAWRTLRGKLVPYIWMPLARTFWSFGEGTDLPDHVPGKMYTLADLERALGGATWSNAVVEEADRFLGEQIPGFPGLPNLFFRYDTAEIDRAIESVLREPLRRYADIVAQFDVDLLVLAGRTSALRAVRRLFEREMPVAPARIQSMSKYRVGDWYPSKWREEGTIRDPKSTVAAGAAILHLAGKNLIPGFLLDTVERVSQPPIYGVWQDAEPHLPRASELFPANEKADAAAPTSPDAQLSRPYLYTAGMTIGFRNVASPEMDGSPLFEVRAATPEVEAALLEDRVQLRFGRDKHGRIAIREVASQKDVYSFGVDDFRLHLKTLTGDRYWLDTGVFPGLTALMSRATDGRTS